MKKIYIGSIISTCLFSGILLAIVFLNTDSTSILEKIKGDPEVLHSEPMEIKTNLSGNHYVSAEIVISTYNKKAHEKMSESLTYPLRDIYVQFLSSKTHEQMSNYEEKEKIKEELKNLIIEELEIPVEDVFFTGLVIQ